MAADEHETSETKEGETHASARISLDPASKTMGIIWVVAGIAYYFVLHKVMKKNVDLEV